MFNYRPPTRDKYLIESEVKDLLSHAKGIEYRILFFEANTGLRPSELNQVRVKDINFNEGYARVRTLKQKKDKKGKTRDVYRDVFLSDTFLGIMKRYIKEKDLKPEDRLFPYSRQWLWEIFKRVAFKAKLNPKYTLYALRHYRATKLLSDTDKDIEYVKNQMGHSDAKITQIYLHILPERIAKYRKNVKTVT